MKAEAEVVVSRNVILNRAAMRAVERRLGRMSGISEIAAAPHGRGMFTLRRKPKGEEISVLIRTATVYRRPHVVIANRKRYRYHYGHWSWNLHRHGVVIDPPDFWILVPMPEG